jgi:cation diffusion facilitator family transporter
MPKSESIKHVDRAKIPVYSALAANIGVCVIKFIVAVFSGSAAVISEGIHSAVDIGNELILLLGMHRSKKAPDRDHPFGYGKEVYFWTLIVSVMIFTLGGGLSVIEGTNRLIHLRPVKNQGTIYVMLLVSFVFEAASLFVAVKRFIAQKGTGSFWKQLHESKDPALFAIIYEDAASILGLLVAFIGISLSAYFQIPQLDGVASILIGFIICVGAVIMVIESRNLLVGESAHQQMTDGIFELVNNDNDVVALRDPLTMHMAPNEILLAIDVEFRQEIDAGEVAKVVRRLETNIMRQYPDVKRIYIEARNLGGANRS